MKLYFSFLVLVLLYKTAKAQQPAVIYDKIADFPILNILNYPAETSSFLQLNDRLLVIDFFGTWCVPCVKAIPHLDSLQQAYKNEIKILLVSEETKIKLENFIQKQGRFRLPVVVDEDKKFISIFQPPSYPFTVIIGKNNRVLAFPSQEELNSANVEKWLKEQESNLNPVSLLNSQIVTDTHSYKPAPSQNKLLQLSQEFSYAAKTGDATANYITLLQQLDFGELVKGLGSDDEKKAFWINLYNAYTQVLLKTNPDQYKERGRFFRSKQIRIAGNQFSLDDIEHGILRRSKIKWSLGHFNKLFPGKKERLLRVKKLDYRLHFALNCGAKSCPPIAFYSAAFIDKQLNLATRAYLWGEAQYSAEENTVFLPAIMSWFRRDFGGKRKMLVLLRELGIVPGIANPKIKFKPYDWSLYLQNYQS